MPFQIRHCRASCAVQGQTRTHPRVQNTSQGSLRMRSCYRINCERGLVTVLGSVRFVRGKESFGTRLRENVPPSTHCTVLSFFSHTRVATRKERCAGRRYIPRHQLADYYNCSAAQRRLMGYSYNVPGPVCCVCSSRLRIEVSPLPVSEPGNPALCGGLCRFIDTTASLFFSVVVLTAPFVRCCQPLCCVQWTPVGDSPLFYL